MQNENGFDFHAIPSATQPARALIIILHGHGNHPDQYVKWAKKTQAQNPDADVLIMRAPIPLHATDAQKQAMRAPGVDDLYSWYNLDDAANAAGPNASFNAASIISRMNAFIDAQLQKRGLADENLALMGFSQGAMVSISAGLHRAQPCAAIVAHSGAALPFNAAAAKPDTLLLIGDADEFFYLPGGENQPTASRTIEAFRKAGITGRVDHEGSVKRLKAAGIDVSEKVFPGQGHRITDASWTEASGFVAKKLKLK